MPTEDPRTAWQRVRDSALSILATEVDGIVNLYGETRTAEDEADVIRQFVENPPGRLHTYQLACRRAADVNGLVSWSEDRIDLVILGYLAARDSGSYDEHLNRSFRIRKALRAHVQAGADSGVTVAEKPSLESFDLVDYCGVACWRSEITWPQLVIESDVIVP